LHPYAHQVYLSVFSSRATSFEARAPGTHTTEPPGSPHRRPPPAAAQGAAALVSL
jgi:hypothetical protein